MIKLKNEDVGGVALQQCAYRPFRNIRLLAIGDILERQFSSQLNAEPSLGNQIKGRVSCLWKYRQTTQKGSV